MSFDLLGKIRITTNGVGTALNQLHKISTSLTNTSSKVARLTTGFVGVGGAIGGALTAATLFNKTIKQAAEFEMRKVTVDAMFGKNHLESAKAYFDLVEDRSAVSMFTQSDFLDAGKSFIPTTKDPKQLEKMLNLAERLGAIDIEQGMTGAAYALKELFSGDGVSMVERFELPRAVINDIKKLPLDKQLAVLDKYLDKIGASNELIEAQSKTTMGQYRKSVAEINKAFRQMGTEGLEYINPLLQEFNQWLKGQDFQRFKTAGINAFGEFARGASDSLRRAAKYIDTNFLSNPEFNKLTTISAKVSFIFETIMGSYNDWLNNKGGRDQIEGVATDVVGMMANALKASEPLIDSAKVMGGALATGIWDGFKNVAKDKPELAALMAYMVTPGTPQIKLAAAGLAYGAPMFDEAGQIVNDKSLTFGQKFKKLFEADGPLGFNTESTLSAGSWLGIKPNGSQAAGIDYVPFDGYISRLHKGETVLTREEAKSYRESGGSGSGQRPIVINMHGTVIRQESDIDKIARQLAYSLTQGRN
ncbi:hypothetical protein [Cohnella phaseoli]|uniref:Uncharacterized protein n=1 Tax=Cohnella phaseoli TaxID=456490 RepID=A0A3D9KI80_9BACL|nr:hypothetical protein [Cohnella phaseoli]RED86208.1 hypothetical protein DFP98_10359 [Cohnella phaseoli]